MMYIHDLKRNNTKKNNKHKVILNLIQALQRLSLSLRKNTCGRCQIKFGMTSLFIKGGFTLIELLVVVLIIGILAAVALPQYQFAVLKSRFVQAKLMVTELAHAEELYYLANGSYSPSMENLDIDFPTTDTESQSTTQNTRTFTWGRCWVASGDEYGARVACSLNEGINLYKYLEHSTVNEHGKFMCRATNADLNSPQNKLCKQESRLDSPTYKYTDNMYWFYTR